MTEANRLSLAQNLAIAKHPSASFIVKMDEDIFLTDGCLDGLFASMEICESQGPWHPGLIAPLLNVNGYTSRILMEKLGKLDEFESLFGSCRQACTETPAWRDSNAAQYLWEVLAPFDETAANFAKENPKFSACPHRFSIGCFGIRREFWESMQGFTVAPNGDLGVEEIDLAAKCAVDSRPIVIAHHILAGHAGFGHQMKAMEPWLLENAAALRV